MTAYVDHLKRHARFQAPYEEADPPSQVTPKADTQDSKAREPNNLYRKKLRSYKGDNE